MKRIAVIESRFGCLHHEVDRNEPSTGWCTKGGRCSFGNCRHIESLEAHDEKVRAAAIDEVRDALCKDNDDIVLIRVETIKKVAEDLKEEKW